MTLSRSLKVHLRRFDLHGRTLRIVTLRPQTAVRFSNNYFHDTWHVLAGDDGVLLLGHLLWGLAFQRQPGTAVLIDHPHLVPTPFEADPPDPLLLVPAGLTSLDDDALRALRLRLRRAPGAPTTIRWHSFGLPRALAAQRVRLRHRDPLWRLERMSRRAGFVCYTAPPEILRERAVSIAGMHLRGPDYQPLAEHDAHWCYGYDGEIQLIPGFADLVSAARVARREVLGGAPARLGDDDRWAIYDRTERALRRLHAARHRRAP
jgi:hypothetical protein